MMMQRRHLKDPLLAHLVRAHLQDHGKRFDHEDAADEWQQQLLLDDYGDCADSSAERQRADVAHKYLCWVRVIPEKSDAGTNHGTTKDGELGDLRNTRQLQIVGEDSVSAHVGKDSQRARSNHSAANRQAVEPVSKVDSV